MIQQVFACWNPDILGKPVRWEKEATWYVIRVGSAWQFYTRWPLHGYAPKRETVCFRWFTTERRAI